MHTLHTPERSEPVESVSQIIGKNLYFIEILSPLRARCPSTISPKRFVYFNLSPRFVVRQGQRSKRLEVTNIVLKKKAQLVDAFLLAHTESASVLFWQLPCSFEHEFPPRTITTTRGASLPAWPAGSAVPEDVRRNAT